MSQSYGYTLKGPSQSSIQAKSVHPTGTFISFKKDNIEDSIPNRFEQQVAKYPNRLAVKTRHHELTYDELNKATNHVAQVILDRYGEGPEPVALLLEKGSSLIVGILGILKAGKIYLPLNPLFPEARISSILEDSQARLVVTNNKNFSLACGVVQHAAPLLNLDNLDFNCSTASPGLSISPDAFAYIMYTSGSTGQPKGVVENHRNVLHRVGQYTNSVHICADDRLTFLGTAVSDVFSALLNGATLYPVDLKKEGLAVLTDWLIENDITIYNSVATVFRHFVSTLTEVEAFPMLRLIKLHGEPVYSRDVKLYKKHFSTDCILTNWFGATETTFLSKYFIDKKTEITGSIVPIGYPVKGSEILLVDEVGEVVDFNSIGEITVKSRYLAPGYWRRSDLTQAAFLPDPEGGSEYIYHTGDLGCMLPDGCLVHMGRKDFQVKVRGFRVEVAEIEMALLNLDSIKQTIVILYGDRVEDKRLVAYLVPATLLAPTPSTLRCSLAKTLPDYMIPSAFVILDALPLTQTGKVDRQALPIPDTDRPQLGTRFVVPRTPVEQVLAHIWGDVLSLSRVGIHDHFIELGGYSLLATEIAARVINTFQVELPQQSLFDVPTVADMAVLVTQSLAEKSEQDDFVHMLNELEALSDQEVQ